MRRTSASASILYAPSAPHYRYQMLKSRARALHKIYLLNTYIRDEKNFDFNERHYIYANVHIFVIQNIRIEEECLLIDHQSGFN